MYPSLYQWIYIRERCTKCRRSYFDLARVVLDSPELKGLDAILSEDMAAIYHPTLETARSNYNYMDAVAPGTYSTEKGAHELLMRPVVSLLPPQYFAPIFPSFDWDVVEVDIKSNMTLTVPVETVCNIARFDRVFVQLDGDLGSPMYNSNIPVDRTWNWKLIFFKGKLTD